MKDWGVRGVALAALIGTVAWLWYSPGPGMRRRHGLDDAIRSGRIARLPQHEHQLLFTELRTLAAVTGVDRDISLNAPLRIDRLNVYIVSPEVQAVTGCGRGNAVYDAELDAIFLDRDTFNLEPYEALLRGLGVRADALRPYRWFLLLHELGHRQLHRRREGLFDTAFGRSRERTREVEADAFALEHFAAMLQAAGGDVNDFKSLVAHSVDVFGLRGSNLTPAERGVLCIAGLGMTHLTLGAFTPTPYGLAYEDSAHPRFVERMLSLLQTALDRIVLSPPVRSVLSYLRQLLALQRASIVRPHAEIQLPFEVTDVRVGQDNVLVFGTTAEGVDVGAVSIPLARLTARFRERRPVLVSLSDPQIQRFPSLRVQHSDRQREVWVAAGASALAGASPLPFGPDWGYTFAIASTGREPAISIWHEGRLMAQRQRADLLSELSRTLKGKLVDLALVGGDAETVTVSLWSTRPNGNEALIGVAELANHSLAVRGSQRLESGELSLDEEHLVESRVNTNRYYRAITVDEAGWSAWELTSGGSPRLIFRQAFISRPTEPVSQDLVEGFENPITTVRATRSGSLVVLSDALYALRPGAQTADILFFPCHELIRSTVGENGQLALFMRDGRKVFVLTSD